MQTRAALQALSKGKHIYGDRVGSSLLDRSNKYIEDYNQIDNQILDRQESLIVSSQLPFVETLRRKVAKLMSEPNGDLPVITRYDLYTGIRKVSERAPSDIGLSKTTTLLERAWHQDPLGTMTYKVVSQLMNQIKDQYPRSKARDAIEAECARVGLHKLPVAKLARIASRIDNQSDYDLAMETHGFGGKRPEQIRARALVRGLVALRGKMMDSNESHPKNSQDIGELVGSKIARLQKEADYQLTLNMLTDAQALANKLNDLVDKASVEAHADGADDVGTGLAQLAEKMSAWVSELSAVGQQALPISEEQVDQSLPQKSETSEVPAKSQEQQDIEDAGIGPKKWYDPSTWFKKYPSTAGLLKNAQLVLNTINNDTLKYELNNFINRLSQFAPPNPAPEHEILETPGEEQLEHSLGVEVNPDLPDGQVTPMEVEEGVDVVEDIQDAADQIIQEAPPEALDYIDHETSEGHGAPPGTAQWGAEEILDEGHDAPPPTDQWLQEEMEEIKGGPVGGLRSMQPLNELPVTAKAPPGMEDVVMKLKKQYPGEPEKAFATAWSIYNKHKKNSQSKPGKCDCGEWLGDYDQCLAGPDCILEHISREDWEFAKANDRTDLEYEEWVQMMIGDTGDRPSEKQSARRPNHGNGIPVPGKIKTQPKVTTYAKEVGKDGGQVLKTSQIEDSLLSGNTVKIGNVSISINQQNEIELHNKTSGRACDLLHMDTAIADFIAMVKSDEMERKASRLDYVYDITQLVNVPCESCGDITLFEKAADIKTGQYGCLCGHRIAASTVDELMRLMPWTHTYELKVKYNNQPSRYVAIKVLQQTFPDVEVRDNKKFSILSSIINSASKLDVSTIHRIFKAANARPGRIRVAQMGQLGTDPPATVTPASGGSLTTTGPSASPIGESGLPPMDFNQVAQAAMTNYRAQGMTLPEALKSFMKEHGERWGEGPDNDSIFMTALTQTYGSSGAPATSQAAPPPQPTGPGMMASKHAADSKMKEPTIRKPKDHVSVPNDLGPDSETKKSVPTPGRIKTQPNKEQHQKLAPKDLGPDSETKKSVPTPGITKVEHNPRSQPGVRLPDNELDPDSEPNTPFEDPSLGAVPQVHKAQTKSQRQQDIESIFSIMENADSTKFEHLCDELVQRGLFTSEDQAVHAYETWLSNQKEYHRAQSICMCEGRSCQHPTEYPNPPTHSSIDGPVCQSCAARIMM